MKIVLTTNDHLGDTVVLSAAIRNAKAAFPDLQIAYSGNYSDVFLNNPDVSDFDKDGKDVIRLHIRYAPFSQKRGDGGNLCEGFSRNLATALKPFTGRLFDVFQTTPYICLSDDEKRPVVSFDGGYCVLNANCQRCSEVKSYPWFQQIIDRSPCIAFVQIGGNEKRDISQELRGVFDYRGRTSIRELFRLVIHAKWVLSPPSAVVNIAAAFPQVKSLVLTGAREPVVLTGYANARHFATECDRGKYDNEHGCMRFFLHGERKSCDYIDETGIRRYARCMGRISPKEVAACLE